MKLAVKRERILLSTLSPGAESAPGVTERETSTEVPTSTIAKVSTLLSAILAAGLTGSQILSNVLGSLTGASSNRAQVEISKAQMEVNKERMGLVDENFRVQLLQRVLGGEDKTSRTESLKLLLASGLLKDSDGKLAALVNTNDYNPPQWKPRDPEPLKETLSLVGGSVPAPQTNQSGGGSGTNTTTTSGGNNSTSNQQTGTGNTSGDMSNK